MKPLARLKEHPWLPVLVFSLAALFSVGCSSSKSNSDANLNPLGAYITTSSDTSSGTVIDGSTIVPGSNHSPIISVPQDGSSSINGHDNAPLLTNTHAGWQQSSCLSCHNEQTTNPDHNYNDNSLCCSCHGTNGLPGFADSIPPVLSGVVVSPTANSVTITWKSDEDCISRLVLKTSAGDKMEFPVSTTYKTSHKYTVNGLQPSTFYTYELICTDKCGNKTTTSSFSTSLQFQTPAATVTPTVTPVDPVEPIEEDPFFTGFTYKDMSDGMVKITFNTREAPDSLWWYVYTKDKEEAAHDDLYGGSKSYNENIETYLEPGNYYVRLKAIVGSNTPYYSNYYPIILK